MKKIFPVLLLGALALLIVSCVQQNPAPDTDNADSDPSGYPAESEPADTGTEEADSTADSDAYPAEDSEQSGDTEASPAEGDGGEGGSDAYPGDSSEEPPQELPADPIFGEALVDSVTLEQRGANYVAIVNGNLNDGCTQIHESTQSVTDTNIQILLTTVRPGDVMCTQQITPYTEEIVIDGNGLAQGDYTVDVNGVVAEGSIIIDESNSAAIAVSGTVSYSQRIALPENATLTVQIQDTSLADAPAMVIGEQSYVTEGQQVPLQFEVPFDQAAIEDNHDYTLSVRITLGHILLFINDTAVPVITKGNPTSDVAVTVVPVNRLPNIAPKAPEASEVPDPITTAVNKTWHWAGFSDPVEGPQEINSPERYELILNEDGTANIKADCNRVGATYTVDGNGILIELGPTTLAACPPDSLADQYLQNLTAARIFFFQEDEMFFDLFADSGTMRFAEPEAPSVEDLIGPLWQWVDFSVANTSTAVANPEKYSIHFLLDGVANIVADCNNILANYTIEDDSISLEMGPTTMVFCGEESLDQQFVQGLNAVTTFRFEGELLYLDMAEDAGSLGLMGGGEQVTGNVVYNQRIALPEDTLLTVTVQDVSLADAPSILIGAQTYTTNGAQVPLPYTVSYNPDVIQDNHQYSVAARITDADGKLLFINDTMIPVITNDNPTNDVEVQVIQVN